MLRLLATEHMGNVTSRKHSHSWKMHYFQTVWGRRSLRKYCRGKQTHAFTSIMVLLGSKTKMATTPCIMPKQRAKYIKKYGLNYFSGQPAVAGDQAPSQEKQSLKLGWPEKPLSLDLPGLLV